MPKKIKIMLEVTVRDLTKAERDEEGLDIEDCRDAAKEFDGCDLADTIAQYVYDDQDELLAGSGAMVKVISVHAAVED